MPSFKIFDKKRFPLHSRWPNKEDAIKKKRDIKKRNPKAKVRVAKSTKTKQPYTVYWRTRK